MLRMLQVRSPGLRVWRYPALTVENLEIKDVKPTVEKFQPDLLVRHLILF